MSRWYLCERRWRCFVTERSAITGGTLRWSLGEPGGVVEPRAVAAPRLGDERGVREQPGQLRNDSRRGCHVEFPGKQQHRSLEGDKSSAIDRWAVGALGAEDGGGLLVPPLFPAW